MRDWLILPNSTKQSLLAIAFVTFSCILGIDIYTPSLPSMVTYFATTHNTMQLASTLFLLGASIGMFFWGYLSDQYGRRIVIILGALLVFISAVLASFCEDIQVFLSLRLLQGVGAGAPMCLARVIAADLLNKRQLATVGSTLGLITGMGPMVAPILGGIIEESFSWQYSFLAYASFAGFSLLNFLAYYQESAPKPTHEGIFKSYYRLFTTQELVLLGVSQGVVLSIVNSYHVIAPFLVIEELGESALFFGFLGGFLAFCQLMSKVTAPSFIYKHGASCVHRAGWLLLIVSALLLLLRFLFIPSNTHVFIITIGISFYCIHLIVPYLFSQVMTIPSLGKGTLGSGFSSIATLTSFALSTLVALIDYEGSGLLGSYYIVLALLGLMLYSRIKEYEQSSQ